MFHIKTFVSLCSKYQISLDASPSRCLKAFIHEKAHKYSDLLLLSQQALDMALVFFRPETPRKYVTKKQIHGNWLGKTASCSSPCPGSARLTALMARLARYAAGLCFALFFRVKK